MEFVLLVVQGIVAVTLIGVILIQRTAQDGGGLMGGGGTMGGLFTPRGSANALTKFTKFLAVVFMLNSLFLGYIASSQHQSKSILDQIPATAPAAATPAAPAPEAPKVPAAPDVPLAK